MTDQSSEHTQDSTVTPTDADRTRGGATAYDPDSSTSQDAPSPEGGPVEASDSTRDAESAKGSDRGERTDSSDDHEADHAEGRAAADDSSRPDTADGTYGTDRVDDDEKDPEQERREEAEKARAAEEFAKEHDPADHDIAAGEEFRQRGDWTAEDGDGPQVLEADGSVTAMVLGSAAGSSGASGSSDGGSSDSSGAGASDAGSSDAGSSDAGSADATDGRRTSSLEEVRDGGYGVGSAAPLDDGALPLGHPVKAWEDTMTFVVPAHPSYGDAEPHVWFLDADAAQNAGFTPVP